MIVLFELMICPHCKEVKKIVKCDQIIEVTQHEIDKYSLTVVPTVIIFENGIITHKLDGLEMIKRFFSKDSLDGVPPSV
jgi:protein-disulfide isomerase